MRRWPWLLLPGAVVIAAAPFTPSPDPLPGRSGGPVQERSGSGTATPKTPGVPQGGPAATPDTP